MDLTERRDGVARHPWEVQRFEAYRRVLNDHEALGARRVLDVGAGDGWFSDQLASHLAAEASIVCWDVNYDDVDLEPADGAVERTRHRPTPGFDLVLVLDVLEHISDPVSFVRDELVGLAPSGTPVLIAVPAYQRLFGAHDVALGHHRRYSRERLVAEIDPWIDVVEQGSLFTSLLLPRAVQVAVERRGTRSHTADNDPDVTDRQHGVGGWTHGSAVTKAVGGALAADARFGRILSRRGVALPGLSLWAYGVVR